MAGKILLMGILLLGGCATQELKSSNGDTVEAPFGYSIYCIVNPNSPACEQ